VALLERHLAAPERAERADRSFVLLVLVSMLAMAVGLLALGILLTRWVFRALGVA
jgi:Tfp pilus assembly protein PilV